MTTFDPDTQEQDLSVLRKIRNEFGGTRALDCDVIQDRRIVPGDSVTLLDAGSPLIRCRLHEIVTHRSFSGYMARVP